MGIKLKSLVEVRAECLKQAENKVECNDNVGGGRLLTIQRPKRKRAFHRALKRGEQWALHEQAMQDMMASVNRLFAERVDSIIMEAIKL